jgi:hypothetical protein
MKQLIGRMTAAVAVAGLMALLAQAEAATPFTEDVNLAATNAYQVTRDYQAEKLLTVEAFGANATTGTVAFVRIREDRTNAVGSITLAGGAGVWRATNTVWLFRGDRLEFKHNAGATSSVVEITGELSSQ